MTFRWRYEDDEGKVVDHPGEQFGDQDEAEEWLGAHWRDLLDAGVSQVTLLEGDVEVYGPMSLHPPQTDQP